MTTTEILQQARAFIQQGWTQHAYARDANGRPVSYSEDMAAYFCAEGALHRAASGYHVSTIRLLVAALPPTTHKTATDFNDALATTQADVLALYSRAIAMAENGETGLGPQEGRIVEHREDGKLYIAVNMSGWKAEETAWRLARQAGWSNTSPRPMPVEHAMFHPQKRSVYRPVNF